MWLDKNENADPAMLDLAVRLVQSLDPRQLLLYPESGALYQKLARSLDVTPAHLVLAAGSDGVIRAVFESFINPGDRVLHTAPTFAMYPVYSKMYGAVTCPLAYRRSDHGPELTVEDCIDAIKSCAPKLVCLPNPDSPTGTAFDPPSLRMIIEAAGEAGALVLCDEAYYPFYEHTAVPMVKEYEHLVVARTFAKAWGLAGLRIGYAAASPAVAALLHKVRPMYEVNTLAVVLAERVLDFEDEMLASVRRLIAGRDWFTSEMSGLGLRTLSSHGNFLHVAFGERAPAVHQALKDMVLYRQDFAEDCLKGFSRFSATTVERFKPIADRIASVYDVQS
jgi:histidinol-phosphate aminotransferase